MPSRRMHRKSRWGCTECKKRRVKCDELQPSCSNCSRRQTQCEYHLSANSIFGAHHNPSQRHGATRAGESASEEDSILTLPGRLNSRGSTRDYSSPSLNLTDLELLLHWTNSTCQTFSRNDETAYIWRVFVPQEALKQPFLMSGILALSALHISRDKGDDLKPAYIRIASARQDEALSVFRELLPGINTATAKAVFAFSAIIVVYSFAFPHTLDSSDPWIPINELCQVIVLARGAHRILMQASDLVRDSIFSPLLQWDSSRVALPDDAVAAFGCLRSANKRLVLDDPQHEPFTYHEAIDCIQMSLEEASTQALGTSAAQRAAIKLPARYIDLLRERRPFALVLLGYYCTILNRLRHNWCLDGWSMRVCGALRSILDDKWRDLMRWATEDVYSSGY